MNDCPSQKGKAEFEDWEEKMTRERNQGYFFQKLYESDAQKAKRKQKQMKGSSSSDANQLRSLIDQSQVCHHDDIHYHSSSCQVWFSRVSPLWAIIPVGDKQAFLLHTSKSISLNRNHQQRCQGAMFVRSSLFGTSLTEHLAIYLVHDLSVPRICLSVNIVIKKWKIGSLSL